MATVDEFLEVLLSQEGDEYVFGAEASVSDSDPDAFDCSELIEWAAGRVGVEPRVPDGSWYQARHCDKHDTIIDVDEAIATPGALLFRFSSSPFASTRRPRSAHVAVSLGDGRTIEARSSSAGVGVFSAEDRGWTHAGLVPGLSAPEEPAAGPALLSWPDSCPVEGTLRVGDNGKAVRRVQAELLAAGAYVVVDGEFGPKFDRAVREWQTAQGIVVDGIVGPVTWGTIWKAIS